LQCFYLAMRGGQVAGLLLSSLCSRFLKPMPAGAFFISLSVKIAAQRTNNPLVTISLFGKAVTSHRTPNLYQPLVEITHLGCAKAPRFADHKSVNISNMNRLMIDQPRELSRRPNRKFQLEAGIRQF